MTTNKPKVIAWAPSLELAKLSMNGGSRNGVGCVLTDGPTQHGNDAALIRLSDYEALQAECEKLVQALRRISYQASGHECRQTPASDLQRAFADLMRQADDALYCFSNDMPHKQRFCEYAGCCEPAVAEALCHAHLEDWREQQAIDAAMQGDQP